VDVGGEIGCDRLIGLPCQGDLLVGDSGIQAGQIRCIGERRPIGLHRLVGFREFGSGSRVDLDQVKKHGSVGILRLFDCGTWPQLGKLLCPVLLFAGKGVDEAFACRRQHKRIAGIQGFDVHFVAQHGHGCMMVAPELRQEDLVVRGQSLQGIKGVQLVGVIEVVDLLPGRKDHEIVVYRPIAAVEQDHGGDHRAGIGPRALPAGNPGKAQPGRQKQGG